MMVLLTMLISVVQDPGEVTKLPVAGLVVLYDSFDTPYCKYLQLECFGHIINILCGQHITWSHDFGFIQCNLVCNLLGKCVF